MFVSASGELKPPVWVNRHRRAIDTAVLKGRNGFLEVEPWSLVLGMQLAAI